MNKELNDAVEILVQTAKKNRNGVLAFTCDGNGVGTVLIGEPMELIASIIQTLVENGQEPAVRRVEEVLVSITGFIAGTDRELMRILNDRITQAEELGSFRSMPNVVCVPVNSDIN